MPPFTIQKAVAANLDEMVEVWVAAMDGDLYWRVMMGTMSKEQIYNFVKETIHPRVDVGVEIGVMQPWKMVDEENGFVSLASCFEPQCRPAASFRTLEMILILCPVKSQHGQVFQSPKPSQRKKQN